MRPVSVASCQDRGRRQLGYGVRPDSDEHADLIRVVVADDHQMVLHAVAALLGRMSGVEVVGRARCGDELLAILENVQPHVVVTEVKTAALGGTDVIAKIRSWYPAVKIVALSMLEDSEVIKSVVACGASAYVLKDSAPDELEAAVRQVVTSGSYFGRPVMKRLLQRSHATPIDDLTPRQLQILTLIAGGKSARQIGSELGLSSKTVDVHRLRLMERVGIDHIAGLTKYALRHGLVRA